MKKYLKNAIDYCLATTRYSTEQEVIEELKRKNSLIHSKLRYSIAKDIAVYLQKRFKNTLKNVALYGSTEKYNASMYSDIDLLLVVNCFDPKLEKTLKKLNKKISRDYYLLIGIDGSKESNILDFHIINEEPNIMDFSSSYLKYILKNESEILV